MTYGEYGWMPSMEEYKRKVEMQRKNRKTCTHKEEDRRKFYDHVHGMCEECVKCGKVFE